MRLSVPPTRSTALALSRELEFAEEGYDLLEQKREILVLELMQHVEAARREQAEVDELLARAHAVLREAAERVGSRSLARDSIAIPITKTLSVSDYSVMGISIPIITTEQGATEPSFAFADGTAKSDEAMVAFTKALKAISRLAQTQNAVFRLANELRRTQRRVNALSKVFIPDRRETLDYIRSSLEERERESFVILRMIRDRLRSKDAGAGAPCRTT